MKEIFDAKTTRELALDNAIEQVQLHPKYYNIADAISEAIDLGQSECYVKMDTEGIPCVIENFLRLSGYKTEMHYKTLCIKWA